MVANEIKPERVVLQLLGIDKKWVRSPKGEWVDKKSLKKFIKLNIVNDKKQISKNKWWQFWR